MSGMDTTGPDTSNNYVLALSEGVRDTFWMQFGSPLKCSFDGLHPLQQWMVARLVCKLLRDACATALGRDRLILGLKTVFAPSDTDLIALGSCRTMGREEFDKLLVALMQHSFVACVAPRGSGRVVAGSFALKHFLNSTHPWKNDVSVWKWEPDDVDVFVHVKSAPNPFVRDAQCRAAQKMLEIERERSFDAHLRAVYKWAGRKDCIVQEPYNRLVYDQTPLYQKTKHGCDNRHMGHRFDPYDEVHRRAALQVIQEYKDNLCRERHMRGDDIEEDVNFNDEYDSMTVLANLVRHTLKEGAENAWHAEYDTVVGGHFRVPWPVNPPYFHGEYAKLKRYLKHTQMWISTDLSACWSVLSMNQRRKEYPEDMMTTWLMTTEYEDVEDVGDRPEEESYNTYVRRKLCNGFQISIVPMELVGDNIEAEEIHFENLVHGFDLMQCQIYMYATEDGFVFGGPGVDVHAEQVILNPANGRLTINAELHVAKLYRPIHQYFRNVADFNMYTHNKGGLNRKRPLKRVNVQILLSENSNLRECITRMVSRMHKYFCRGYTLDRMLDDEHEWADETDDFETWPRLQKLLFPSGPMV